MLGFIPHNSVEKRSPCINKWLSYSRLQCFEVAILSAILEFVIEFCDKVLQVIPGFIPYNSVENEVSVLINDWVTADYNV